MADIRREPELHAGTCSNHGGFLLFWCRKCSEWVCSDCTIADHRSDTCSVLSMKQAAESFHKEAEEYVRQVDLQFTRSNSLVEECQDWKNASLQLLEILNSVMEILLEKQDFTKTLLEEGNERLSNIKSIINAQFGESLEGNIIDTINLLHKGRKDFGCRFTAWLEKINNVNVRKTISNAVSIVNEMNHMSIQAENRSSLLDDLVITPGKVTPSSLGAILAKDPNMLARGFLLKLERGKFSFSEVCDILGEDNIEHLESSSVQLYIVTMKSPDARDYIVSKIKSLEISNEKRSRNIYSVHQITPIKMKVKVILKGIPRSIALNNLSDIQSKVSETIPILNNISLEFEVWPGTKMCNGNLLITGEVNNIKELDQLVCKKRYPSYWEIPFGSVTGHLYVIQAGPFQEMEILPKAVSPESVIEWKWN